MKQIVACTLVALVFFSARTKVYYVKEGGTGQGTSWEDASGDLNAVLFAAPSGSQIWVTKGTYYPTQGPEREVPFIISNQQEVYGGFEGGEHSLSQRDWKANKTILSGEIGTDSKNDNSLNVVLTKNVRRSTIIDGFTITGGFANENGMSGERTKCGGAWYNDGSGKGNYSNPTIRNCTFVDNYGRDGGAMYNNGNAGEASPVLINCTFMGNRADLDGGALFNDGRLEGKSNPILMDCTIEQNAANFGGGLMNYGSYGMSNPTLNNCSIKSNKAYNKGSGIFNMGMKGIAEPVLKNCRLMDNTPGGLKTVINYPEKEVILSKARD